MSLKTFFLARGTRKVALAQLRLEMYSALCDIAQNRQATPLIDGVKAALDNPSDKVATGFVEFIRVERIIRVKGDKFSLNKGILLSEDEEIPPLLKRFDNFFSDWLKPVEKSEEAKASASLEKEQKYRESLLERLKTDSEFYSWVKTQVGELDHQVKRASLTPITRGELEKLTT